MLRGRRTECAALAAMLDAARSGRSGALVVRGEAGIGKTALLEYAVEAASDMRLVRAVGMESERDLAFATLHQLCAPLLDGLDCLPGPQRDALAVTFGLSSGAAPSRFLVGLAVLSLVAEMARDRPLLCVVDDAQWSDEASAQALGFVARRLLAESVVMLLGAREPGEELRGIPELVVLGLRDVDARQLIASTSAWPLDERVREQLLAEARGNPLALLELPRGLSSAQLVGGLGVPGGRAPSVALEESFARRLSDLAHDTQRLLLVASAEPVGDPALLWRAARRLGIPAQALEAAETAGLLEVGSRVRFRHPLVRSAVYQAAEPEPRREVHRALAAATDAEGDPDRHAWHLADAAAGPDEDVAAALERGADRAQARGGLAAAAALLDRAVEMTPDQERRAERALAAAHAGYRAGALESALALLNIAETAPLDELGRARTELLRAQIAYAQQRGGEASRLLLRVAKRLEPLDRTLARATYRDALEAATWAGGADEAVGVVEVARAVLAAPSSERPGAADLLLRGAATQCAEDFAAGVPPLKRALTAFRDGDVSAQEQLEWSVFTYRSAVDLWDDETWFVMADRFIELARAGGALPLLHFALNARIVADAFSGTLAAGFTRMEELRAVCEVTGSELPPYSPLALAAWRGRTDEVSDLVTTTTKTAAARGETQALSAAQWAAAVLHNAHGRYSDALAAAEQAVAYQHLGFSGWSLAELVLAAVRSGSPERATPAMQQLQRRAGDCGSDWALGIAARSRALLSSGAEADQLYREAIERLARSRMRAELARAYLHHGEWLRGARRQQEARRQLRAAHEMFMAMDAEAFAGRAESELSAVGDRVHRTTVKTRAALTAQEAQIARLARDGLSNPEIGGRLFISPRTVEYHLHKVFEKLGVRSRAQLPTALARQPAPIHS